MLDSKLSIVSSVDYVKKRLGTQCGISSKPWHFVPNKDLMLCYKTNVKSTTQYGILVYGCCCSSAHFVDTKNLETETLPKKRSFVWLVKHKKLSVFEKHIYELLNIVLSCIYGHNCEQYSNFLFEYEAILQICILHITSISRYGTKKCQSLVSQPNQRFCLSFSG